MGHKSSKFLGRGREQPGRLSEQRVPERRRAAGVENLVERWQRSTRPHPRRETNLSPPPVLGPSCGPQGNPWGYAALQMPPMRSRCANAAIHASR